MKYQPIAKVFPVGQEKFQQYQIFLQLAESYQLATQAYPVGYFDQSYLGSEHSNLLDYGFPHPRHDSTISVDNAVVSIFVSLGICAGILNLEQGGSDTPTRKRRKENSGSED